MSASSDFAASDSLTITNPAQASHQGLPLMSNFAAEVANSWLLPDGVVDVLFEDAQKQELLRYQLTQHLILHGYRLVSPPMIEYTESLLSDASEDLKRQTFKIIDQLTGRLMGVRADITPQILRIDAHHGGDAIARYCYAGHVIHTLPSGLFGSRTPLQLGAEIFGCASMSADIELIDVLFGMLGRLELNDALHIDLGHVAIFKRLSELADLSQADTEQLMHLYANKNLPELKRACQSIPMGSDFYALARHGHDVTQLPARLSAAAQQDAQITEAIVALERIKAHLEDQWQCPVSIDITELSGYHYHTGIVFNGYIHNETQPLVRGGRFDGMQRHSEGTREATGFSMDISRLLAHISLVTARIAVVDYAALSRADSNAKQALTAYTKTLRDAGVRVTVPLSADDTPANATHRIVWDNDTWQLAAL
ncbi:ATP phosphoribosyltransferase regulatory subunit [Psychrobacter aestuarii]|uniref:ATP phosphoribosyltransferase regulatory subunit n=1 Tax=Psychrobacter aestuarii TaxID=556327 RepID=A0ABP3FAI6_9GAMM|nr:ATP phosphoribosyltransferase regulatory subunit [Psychrobacter aestuarii]